MGTSRAMRTNLRSERGAVGWLLVGVVIGVIFILWLFVQLLQAIF